MGLKELIKRGFFPLLLLFLMGGGPIISETPSVLSFWEPLMRPDLVTQLGGLVPLGLFLPLKYLGVGSSLPRPF